MPIKSVTHIAGGPRTGKSFIASVFNSKSQHFVIDEDYRSRGEVLKILTEWKESAAERHVVLVGDRIYQTIDFDFGPVPKYYVSCDAKHPFVMPEDKQGKPLFE